MKASHPSKIGRYEVVDRLGAGGMGVVYLATDPLLRRTVAIKVLPGEDDELRERFAREARSAAALRHNNVVTIFDIGEHDGRLFLAMEFIDGESMAELIRRRAVLAVERRLQLIIELCAGLGYAHRNGIIHRDIKPGNLMITSEGSLKILDFGLARLAGDDAGSGLTRVGAVIGTPHYMSPEQVHGEAIDPRSDIFSVGLVLYELLAYRRAFAGEVAHAVLHNIVHSAPTPLSDVLPDADADLVRIVDKAIQKEPDRRYQTLTALAADLERVRLRQGERAEVPTVIAMPAERRPRGSGADAVDDDGQLPETESGAGRRAAQVDALVAAAADHFEAGRMDEAVAECERAVLLSPQDRRALDLMARAHARIDERQVREWLEEARTLLAAGALSEAQALVSQTLMLRPDSPEANELRQELRRRRAARELAAEGSRSATAALERAERSFQSGAFEAAMRSATEVLAFDPDHHAAHALKRRATEAIEARHRGAEPDYADRPTLQRAPGETADPEDDEATRIRGRTVPAARRGEPGSGRGERRAEGRPVLPWVVAGIAGFFALAAVAWIVLAPGGTETLVDRRGVDRPAAPAPGGAGTAGAVRGGEATSPPAAAETPRPGDEATAGVQAALSQALAGNDLPRAVQVLQGAPAAVQSAPALAGDVGRLLVAARGRAAEAFAAAQGEAGARSSPDFKAAQLRRGEATVLERDGQAAPAAAAFLEAATLFTQASRARSSPPPPVRERTAVNTRPATPPPAASNAPPVTTTVVQAPVQMPPAAPQPSVPAPAPVAPASPPEVASPPPTSSPPSPPPVATAPSRAPAQPAPDDTVAIRETLARYVAGYEQLDVPAIKRVFPNAPANLDLSNVRSYSLSLENVEITLQGDRATVTAVRRIRVQLKAGSAQQPTVPTEFSLRRGGSGWIIERVR